MRPSTEVRIRSAKLIINPKAGIANKKHAAAEGKGSLDETKAIQGQKGPAEEIIEAVTEECRRARIKLDIEFTQYPKHAMEIARRAKSKYDLVIAAGGDGTINEIINGIARSKTALAVIPFGTMNVFALELGIPQDFREASRLITNGKRMVIDLGYAETVDESRYYSMVLGIGFDAVVMKDATLEYKKKWGALAYLMSGTKNLLTYKWPKISIKHSFVSSGYLAIVANSRHIWGENQLADNASMTDGLLDLVIINRKNWTAVDLLLSFSKGKLNRYLRREYHQIKQADISAESEVVAQADGEIIGRTPIRVEVVPKALRVIANNGIAAG